MAEKVLDISLKQYKKSIEELRGELLGLTKDSDEYKKISTEIERRQRKLNDVMAVGKKNADAADGSYNALVNQMRELKTQWKATSDEAERNALGKQIAAINQQLKDFDKTVGDNQRSVGDYAIAGESLKSSLKEITDKMAQLALEGEKNSEEYQNLAEQAGKYKDALQDASAEVNRFSSDTQKLDSLVNVATTVTAGFTMVKSTMTALGVESEDTLKSIEGLQTAMGTLQSLQAFQKAITDNTASGKLFSNAIDLLTGKTSLYSKNITQMTVVQEGATTAQKAGAVASRGLSAAMNAIPLMAVATAALLVITNFKDIVEWFGKTLGLSDSITKSWNKMKEVASGVFNVISEYFKGIGGVFEGIWEMMQGNFTDGLEKIKSSAAKARDIAGNYAKGAEEELTRQHLDAEKKRAKADADAVDAYIKRMEKREGADWKYTEDGKRKYKEYYAFLKAAAKGNAEELQRIEDEEYAHNRELNEKTKKGNESVVKSVKEKNKKIEDAEKEHKRILDDLVSQSETFGIITKTERDKVEESYKKLNEIIEKAYKEQLITKEKYDSLLADAEAKRIEKLASITENEASTDNNKRGGMSLLGIDIKQMQEELDFYSLSLDEQTEKFKEHNQRILDIQKERIEKEIEILENENRILSGDEWAEKRVQNELKIAKLRADQAKQESSLLKKQADDEKKIDETRTRQKEKSLNTIAKGLSQLSNVVGETTEAGKGFAVAEATIDTYSAANKILNTKNSEWGPGPFGLAAKIAAMVSVIGSGIANVSSIMAVNPRGGSGVPTSSTPSVSSSIGVTPLLNENQDMINMTSLSYSNGSDQKVVILQSEIGDTLEQNRVRIAQTSF